MLINRPTRAFVAVAACGAVAAGLVTVTAPAATAAGKPNLQVAKAGVNKTTVAEGDQLTITHAVRNRGKGTAAPSTTRFYLTTNADASIAERKASRTNPRSSLTDILLTGSRSIGKVKPGRTATGQAVTVTVPVGTPAGRYVVLVCADDRGAVAETNEADNCKVADTRLTVREAAGSDTLVVQQFADTQYVPDDEQGTLQWIKAFCQSTYPAKSLTLRAAIDGARVHLERVAGAGVIQQLNGSGQADSPESAQELAATAVAAGSPGLALAALLRAYDLQPRNGSHLVNAAAVATSIGLPNEAIAFLDGAAGRDFLRPALGISQQATALTIRGQALVMTGRASAARRLFVAARQAAPLLREADAGLATVEGCSGNDALAMRYTRRSRVRSDEPVPPTPPTETPELPTPEFDITRGEPMPLRQLPIAETPAQGVEMEPTYQRIHEGFIDEIQASNDERTGLEQHLSETDDARTRAEIQRREGILALVYSAHEDGEVEAAEAAFYEVYNRLDEEKVAFWAGTTETPSTYTRLLMEADAACPDADEGCFVREINRTCRPALVTAHNRFRTDIARLQDLGDAYLDVWSRRMSGLAANLLDEEAHRIALIAIEDAERGIYSLIVQQAEFWTQFEKTHKDHCVEPLPAEVLAAPETVGADSPGACPEGLKALSWKMSLGPTSLRLTCEKFQQSFSAQVLPLVNAYADITYDFRTGSLTVFAGAKGGSKVGVVDAGFKSGIYLTSDSQGDIKDVGWRVGPSVYVTNGGPEYSAFKDEIDISFVPELTVVP